MNNCFFGGTLTFGARLAAPCCVSQEYQQNIDPNPSCLLGKGTVSPENPLQYLSRMDAVKCLLNKSKNNNL